MEAARRCASGEGTGASGNSKCCNDGVHLGWFTRVILDDGMVYRCCNKENLLIDKNKTGTED
jgi:hypothetical protein